MSDYCFDDPKIVRKLRMTRFIKIFLAVLEECDVSELGVIETMDLCMRRAYEETVLSQTAKRISQAGVYWPNARLDAVIKSKERNITSDLIASIKRMHWLEVGANIVIYAQSGAGKSYLASAIAAEAILHEKKVCYVSFIEWLVNGLDTIDLDKLVAADLLVIDDFMLQGEYMGQRINELIQVLSRRESAVGKATVVTSQYLPEEWLSLLGNTVTAQSVVNRIIHGAMGVKPIRIKLGDKNFRAEDVNPSSGKENILELVEESSELLEV